MESNKTSALFDGGSSLDGKYCLYHVFLYSGPHYKCRGVGRSSLAERDPDRGGHGAKRLHDRSLWSNWDGMLHYIYFYFLDVMRLVPNFQSAICTSLGGLI